MQFDVMVSDRIQNGCNNGVAYECYSNRECRLEMDDVPTEEELMALMTWLIGVSFHNSVPFSFNCSRKGLLS